MEIELLGTSEEGITSILRLRHARARMFGPSLFADSAWDILLQLFAAKLGGREVMLSDLEIAAPTSTVARWAAVLEERGLIACRLDSFDSDKLRLELSSAGTAKMADLFHNLQR